MATIIDDDCNIPQKKCETSANYNKDDIVDIADKCGVDIYNEKGKLKLTFSFIDRCNHYWINTR